MLRSLVINKKSRNIIYCEMLFIIILKERFQGNEIIEIIFI